MGKTTEFKPVYLVMVTSTANNNKYYKMIPDGNGKTWTAEFGRIGASCQKKAYSLDVWDKKYREKVNKGYVDQSDLVADLIVEKKTKKDKNYKEIENEAIAEIVEILQNAANKAIKDNYTISSDSVTQAMVDEAQKILAGLLTVKRTDKFNRELLRLFSVIPRKMKNVDDYLAKQPKDFGEIIQREQNTLDIMKGQVIQHSTVAEIETVESDSEEPAGTILDVLGLEFEECTREDIARIKSLLGDCADKFSRAWRVTNKSCKTKFDEYVKENKIENIKLLFHGSRTENWWSIIQTGLVLKPTNAVITGKMFGYGIYYAPKAAKSLNYTSLSGSYWTGGRSKTGYMALMEVAYGKPYDVYSFDSKYYDFNYEKLQKACKGANCLHAHAGQMLRNDEIVVYKEAQCSIKYLIELK